MLFKNATFFLFSPTLEWNHFDEQLQDCELKPVQGLELVSRGFVSPYGEDSEVLKMEQGPVLAVHSAQQERLLPGAVVNEALQKKLREIEKADGRRPGSKKRAQIKSDLILEMLPKAFIKSARTTAILDTSKGWIAVDTASRKQAENVVSEIRRAMSSFPALPLNAEQSPRQILTSWLMGGDMPEGLVLGHEAELQDPAEQGATIKVARMDLANDELRQHVEAGFQVVRLALIYNDRIGLTFGDDLVVRKIKLLEAATENLDTGDDDDARAERDALLALMHGELAELFQVLAAAFRFTPVQ